MKNRKSNSEKDKNTKKKLNIKDKLFILCFIIFILSAFKWPLLYHPILDNFNKENIKAVIIPDEEFIIPNQKVFVGKKRHYTYSYKFYLNDREYHGDSRSVDYKVGDTVLVEYNKIFPFMNRLVEKK